jgi:antitoxin ParD1/3/4
MALERMTITMPSEMASMVQAVVDTGDYATVSEVIREAVREWRARRVNQQQELRALENDIQKGLADLEAGRLKDFDVDRIAARGRKLLPGR